MMSSASMPEKCAMPAHTPVIAVAAAMFCLLPRLPGGAWRLFAAASAARCRRALEPPPNVTPADMAICSPRL